MNSPAIIKFTKPTFCLVIFSIFSSLCYLPCASSQQEPTWCADLFQCGHITAGFPFWGGKRPDYCGHQLLGLHCNEDSNTSLVISGQEYSVLDVDQASYTLTLARTDLQGPFCSAKFNTTTLPPDIFELSPIYKSVTVSYLCDPPDGYYLSSNFTCLDKGIVSVSQNSWSQFSCNESFTVTVPMSYYPDEGGESDLIGDLERVLSEGFKVKVKIDEITCQACSSSGGICSFNGTTQVCCKTNSPLGVSCEQKRQRSAAELHNLCSTPFICGNHGGLLYPFWIQGREECGHPDFKLNCTGGFAELNISSVTFRILEANYDAGIIRLARSDSLGDLCDPQYILDTPFNEIALPFAPNTELLTIYYTCMIGCSRICYPSYVSTYVGKLDCGAESYYVTRNLSSPLLKGIRGQLYQLSVSCSKNISIPASGPALKTLRNNRTIGNLKNAIEDFERGVDQDCSRCRGSGGACGYDHITRRFLCYSGSRHKGISSGAKIGSGVGLVLFMLLVFTFCLKILRKRKIKTSDDLCHKNLRALNHQGNLKALIPLKQYSYTEVKRITKSFAEMVGKGGFGTVYKGTLSDGRMVAVKILKDSKTNREDFINEVASISQTSHVNIVTLLGFCSEGSKRAIIYEFLENGSLDKFISSKRSSNMDWRALYQIALGVAHGLEYLHHGCRTRIVHFDINHKMYS